MENSLQNKAMFFAAYLFQSAVTEMSNPETITPYFLQYADLPIFQVELKSIDNITEEDLNYCSQICFKNTRMTFASVKDYLEQNYLFGFFMDEEVDYLREKGYAVKWRGLSVEKQIEYGWIKLKKKSDEQ